jgi:hypothetical protein
MKVVNDAIDWSRKTKEVVRLDGWFYDIVLDRLHSMGFRMRESGHDGQWECSFHNGHEGEFRVATNRLEGPFTVVQYLPSEESN